MIENPFIFAAGLVFLAMGGALIATRRHHAPAVALAVYVIGLGIPYAILGGFAVPAAVVWASSFAAAGIPSGLADAFLWYAGRVWSGPFLPGYEARFFLFGFWTLMPMALLAYVVLKGQIEGLDLKVRWGISRSTVAGAFVAAFFIASEGAQLVFGRDNELIGLLAAGALVFAIAPLQRGAERLAEKAVPATGVAERPRGGGPHQAYRLAVLAALREDGAIGPREEQHLADLADELGIRAGDALRVRREAASEREASP